MAKKGRYTVAVDADTSPAEKKISKAFKDKTVKIKLDPKDFSQPLGRITGQLGEFDKSLAASNARVIAFGASASAIYAIQKALSSTVKAAITVEKTLADINVILNASGSGLKKFSDQLFKIAGNTGQSFDAVAQAATELARQGLSVEQTLKRTSNALILTRLSGLDAASSVESLTAAINSFNKTAITSTEIVNKLANVDAAFAVSSKDLAEAIRRVGSTASDANVSFDELVAAVTAAQQVTARGGAVIGNSFKTIFTRLQRPKVLDALRDIGIETRNLQGETRPVIKILQDLAKVYDKLAPSVRSTTSELIGGVFQINVVKAALSDLGKQYSIYDSALKTSISSTDEANKRNEALNQTMSAMLNKTFANLQKVAASAGQDMFGPMMKNLVGLMNGALDKLGQDADAKDAGSKIASGIFKGIGDFLSGPGLLVGAVTLFRVVQKISETAGDALRSIVMSSKAQEKQKDLKVATFNMLTKEPDILEQVLNKTMSVEDAHKKVLERIEAESDQLREQMKLADQLAQKLMNVDGVGIPETGPFAGRAISPKKGGKKKASGYKPDWMGETIAMSQHGYSMSDMRDPGVRAERIFDGRGGSFMASVNKHEQVSTVKGPGGKKGTFVIPPKDSDAFKNLKAGGFTPNFAKVPKLGKSLDFSRKGSIYDISGTVGDVLNMYSSRQGIGSPFWKKMKSAYQNNLEVTDMVRMTAKVGGISGSKNPYHLEELARKQTGSYDPAAKAQGKGRSIRGAKGGLVKTRSGYQIEGAQFYPTDIGSGKYKGFQFSRGDAKRKAGMQTKMAFFKGTIGKNLVASLMEMDPRIQPGKPNGFNEGVRGDVDFVNLGNFLLAMDPNDKIPMSMDQIHDKKSTKNPTLKHGLVSSLMGQGRKKAGGFVPNFATGIYDSDYIPGQRTAKQAILDAITGSGKPIKTVMGASGSGKSTYTSGMGKRITSMGQVGKFDDYIIIYGGGKSKKHGGLTAQGKQVFGATTGGVTAIAPSNQEIYSRRIGRLNKARHRGMPDKRDYQGLMGAMRAPYNQYDFMANVKKMMKGRGQSFNVVRAGGYIPNFASEALTIKNTRGVTVKAGKAGYDWNNMSEKDFRREYGDDHYNERVNASKAGLPWSKWKQGQNRKSRQGETQFIKSPHVMLTADTNLGAGRSTVKKIVDGKNYSVQFPHGGLRDSPAGAGTFKGLINQEMSEGLSNVYDRLGFKRLESKMGTVQSPNFDRVMRQSNVDQTMGNLFDGIVKRMVRSSSKTIDDDSSNTDWDIKSTTGSVSKAFHTKEGLKGDLKLSAYGDGPLDFAEKVLRDKGIMRTKKGRALASGFVPSFAKGVQKAILAEKMFGGKGASPVLDYSDELRSKGMSGLYVRDKKQRGMGGVKKDHGGLSNALKDSKRMQGRMASGYVPNFAKDEFDEDSGKGRGTKLMIGMMAPMIAQTTGELIPQVKSLTTAIGEAAGMYYTITSMWDSKTGEAVGRLVALGIAFNRFSKNIRDKSEEFNRAAGHANENMTKFSNGMQGYLTNFEAFNNAVLDNSKSAAEVARIHNNMANSLAQIDAVYHSQLLAASSVEEAQNLQADIMKEMARETRQINFAAEMQKTMTDMRDALSSTEILERSGNLKKLGKGMVESIGSDNLAGREDIKELLSGDQDEVISKLQSAFDLDPKLVESLEDMTGGGLLTFSNEFGALMDELEASAIELQNSEKLLKNSEELRKKENERLKVFKDAVVEADARFTDFVNALRTSGDTLNTVLSSTLKTGLRQQKANRATAFAAGQSLIKGNQGLSASNRAQLEFDLGASKRRGDLRDNAQGVMQDAQAKMFDMIGKSFTESLGQDKGDPKQARDVDANTDKLAEFAAESAAVARRIASLDPIKQSQEISKEINSLAIKFGDPDKRTNLMAELNKESAKTNGKLADIQIDSDKANTIAEIQLQEQKRIAKETAMANRLGGTSGFLNPQSLEGPLSEFSKSLSLMQLSAGAPGKTGMAGRGRGALGLAISGQQLGLFEEGSAASRALGEQAVPGMMNFQKGLLSSMLSRQMGTRQSMARAGEDTTAIDTAIKETQALLTPQNLEASVRKSIETKLKTADPAKIQLELKEVTKILTDKTEGLSKTMQDNLNVINSGGALNAAIVNQTNTSMAVVDSQAALVASQQTLEKETKTSAETIRLAMTEFSNQLIAGQLPGLRESALGPATQELIDNNSSFFRNDPSAELFIQELEKMAAHMRQVNAGGGNVGPAKDLQDFIHKAGEAGYSLDGWGNGVKEFTGDLKESTKYLDLFVRSLTAGQGAYNPSGTSNARGFVPNTERRMAAQAGYAAGNIRSMNVGGRRLTYNSAETVKRFPGMTEPAIMPPASSKAGSDYTSRFMDAHGFDPYAADGFVPNFAKRKRSKRPTKKQAKRRRMENLRRMNRHGDRSASGASAGMPRGGGGPAGGAAGGAGPSSRIMDWLRGVRANSKGGIINSIMQNRGVGAALRRMGGGAIGSTFGGPVGGYFGQWLSSRPNAELSRYARLLANRPTSGAKVIVRRFIQSQKSGLRSPLGGRGIRGAARGAGSFISNEARAFGSYTANSRLGRGAARLAPGAGNLAKSLLGPEIRRPAAPAPTGPSSKVPLKMRAMGMLKNPNFYKGAARAVGRGAIAGVADYGIQSGLTSAGVGNDSYGDMMTRSGASMATGLYFGGPAGLIIGAGVAADSQIRDTMNKQLAVQSQMFGGGQSIGQQKTIAKAKRKQTAAISRYRGLQQSKANIEEMLQRNEGYTGWFDLFGDDIDEGATRNKLAEINKQLAEGLPAYQKAIQANQAAGRRRDAVAAMHRDPKFQQMQQMQQRMKAFRDAQRKAAKARAPKPNYIKYTGGTTAQALIDQGINLHTGKPMATATSKTTKRRPPSITAGVRPKGGWQLNPNTYASKEDRREAFRQGITVGQLYTNQNRFIDETGKHWNDMRREASGKNKPKTPGQIQLEKSRASRSKWIDPKLYGTGTLPNESFLTPAAARRESDRLRDEALARAGYANGFVPNADAARDAVRREIGAGLNRNQIQVHAVTNTRDEPRGLKDVPNYAASEEAKQMLAVLRDIFNEISRINEESSNEGGGTTSESTVKHINSPLSINVSGSIEETSSNIDKQVFDAVVKAVEKLRGGIPVAPPKSDQGVN